MVYKNAGVIFFPTNLDYNKSFKTVASLKFTAQLLVKIFCTRFDRKGSNETLFYSFFLIAHNRYVLTLNSYTY